MRFLALSVAMVRQVHYHSVPVFQRPFGAILDSFLILVLGVASLFSILPLVWRQ
jgi:hypothetical protein